MREYCEAKISGVICNEIEPRVSGAGKPYVKIPVVVNIWRKDEQKSTPTYYDIYVNDEWLMERVVKFNKGDRIFAEGTIQAQGWKAKDSDEIRTKVVLWAYGVYFMPKQQRDGTPDLLG